VKPRLGVTESNSAKGRAAEKNVTILGLPGMISVLHIVCPLGSHAITCC
jgi:hypothetical protein